MNRTSLGVVVAVLLLALPEAARAADPPATGPGADPLAPPAEGSESSSAEDQEAAVRGAPARPPPATQTPPPAPARPTPASARARRAQANDEDHSAAPAAAADQSGLALELSTSGFASGPLTGGLF